VPGDVLVGTLVFDREARHIPWRAVHFEPVAAAAGAVLIIAAHVLNVRFSRRCPCCEPAGGHTAP